MAGAQTTPAVPGAGLSPAQKIRAERLTSLFENDTLKFQYGYAEKLGDGRGITAGRVGFTTGTGDACEVVMRFTAQVPGNGLAVYLPELLRLNEASNRDDTSGLGGFISAWQQAARDPRFCAVQDAVMDEMYYEPAVRHADELGLHTALARAAIYDAIIQHGDGEDQDGVPALIRSADKAARGNPKTGTDEKVWLHAFLEARRADLAHSFDPATRKAWAESVDRVDVFLAIEASGNYDLHGPIKVHSHDFNKTIP